MKSKKYELACIVTLGVLFLSIFPGSLIGEAKCELARYPTRPIELIIPYPAGGRSDLNGRILASVAHQYLGVPVACINKVGGRGVLAADYVLKAKPDGYTILVGSVGVNLLWPLQGIGKYDIFDFVPIGRISTSTMVMVTSPDKPWKNLQQLIEGAKKNPRSITYSTVKANMAHLAFLAFSKAAGTDFRFVAVEGDAYALSNTLGGHTDLYIATTVSTVLSHCQAGKLRALAVFSEKQNPALPNTPTLKELGIDVSLSPWTGIVARRGIPDNVLNVLRKAFDQIVTEDKAFPRLMSKIGEQIDYMSGADLEEQWKKEAKTLGEFIKELGLRK